MASKDVNIKIGDILVRKNVLSREQLEKALSSKNSRLMIQERIGNFLIEKGFATEDQIADALGAQFNLPVMHLDDLRIKPEILDLIPENMARKFSILPLFEIEGELTLAVSDPTDIHLLDIVRSQTGYRVIPVITPFYEITEAISKFYSQKIEHHIDGTIQDTETAEITRSEIEELKRAGVELPIVKIVDRALLQAIEDDASDIHIEPRENSSVTRFRIDGILQEYHSYSLNIHPAIVSRIKILSSLDIAERQKPQDGRIQIKIENNEFDIRVSTLPTHHGEKVVMRLLNRSSVQISIDELGFSEGNLKAFQGLIREPYGIILVTGPTGSGKTTTLYAALNEINTVEKNIITIEDPIEYQLSVINQIQVNPKKNLTFATALRFILRQDPDIMMVGEIRDPETASIAAESALTGHLVFSTLHTNNALSSITRLTDMGVEPFLLAPSLLGIIAQRLVRKICPQCKESYQPSQAELNAIGLYAPNKDVLFYRGTGCVQCKDMGYKGRTSIHELLVLDENIRGLITDRAPLNILRAEALKSGFKDIRFDGLKKVFAGTTSIEELLRVTRNIK
jgi:type IV pilus assembly protein PilB